MPYLCPWPRNSLTYDGCCSHVSIQEHIFGQNEDATFEEINHLAAEKKSLAEEKKTIRRRIYNAKEGGVAHKAYGDKALQEQRYQCTPCGLSFRSKPMLQKHLRTQCAPIYQA